jgi:transposase
VGLDVHKASLEVGLAQGGRGGEVRHYGQIEATPGAVAKLFGKLGGNGRRLLVCYEAGPCGYGLYRQLRALGHECVVVAPSMIPKRPGDRVKTDRRDCLALARLHRAGELTAVWVPDAAHEAMRDLVRVRQSAATSQARARQQLQGFLLRHGRIYPGRTPWGRAHRLWLAAQRFDHPAQQIAFEDLISTIETQVLRRQTLEAEIQRLVPQWSMAPVAGAYQALRGVSAIIAISLAAELGDLSRFETPRQLMGYLGITASEDSSGKRRRRGAITKAGNSHARRMLVEGAWSYRLPARLAPAKLAKTEHLPKAVRDIAWKAQARLCARYRHLRAAGRTSNVAVVAIAREMAAFLWAIARITPPTTS